METLSYGDKETCRYGDMGMGKRKTEDQPIFLNPFTVCSSCKRKVVVCQFVDEETNGSCLFTNGLHVIHGINGLAHLYS
jgi:hypothetical protein